MANTESLSLRCDLSEEELKGVANKIAQKTSERQEVEDTKKSVAAQYKADIEALQAEINRCAVLYRNGYEVREVQCELIFDWQCGMVYYVRSDTGEVAKERPITNGERQMRLDEVKGEEEQEKLPSPDGGGSEESDEQDLQTQRMNRFMSQETAVQM